jgi:hypothetical protein
MTSKTLLDAGFKDIEDFITATIGTCDGYKEVDFAQLTDEEVLAIDDAMFECEDCGWWCEAAEESDNDKGRICEDCNEAY